MTQIHGQATIRINGQVIESEDDASLIVGGKKNTGRMIGQKYNYSQTTFPGQVTCKVPVDANTSIRSLQEIVGAEVIFESDTGRTYVIRNAVQENELELSGGEGNGTVELLLKGEPAEEMV